MSAPAADIDPAKLNVEKAGFFRFRRLAGRYLITNDIGRHALLEPERMREFIEGRLDPTTPLHARLVRDGFIRDQMDFDALAALWRGRHRYLWQGPGLHVVVVTLRCNHRCLYCHASSRPMSATGVDMTLETADLVVDRILQTPSPSVTIEFQGGEPLANWPVVRRIIERSREKNKVAGKNLWLNLVSNLTLLDDEKLDFLIKNGVSFCTSLDGPADLHDRNRPHPGGSYAQVRPWFDKISRRTSRKAFRIEALLTVTRQSLTRARDIVDEYAGLGLRGIFLRPLNQMGMARETWDRIGYGPEEFLAFYREAFERVLEINKKKVFFEQKARILLAKILSDDDPNFLDLRSPCGAGVGQMAYDIDGGVYTCDEGRMFARMGDESFRIGQAGEKNLSDDVSHPTVRALQVASCLDNQPRCSECAYKPYCGVCPIQCYGEQGDIMGRMPSNASCRINMGILDLLFEKLNVPKYERMFRRWIRNRPEEIAYRRS